MTQGAQSGERARPARGYMQDEVARQRSLSVDLYAGGRTGCIVGAESTGAAGDLPGCAVNYGRGPAADITASGQGPLDERICWVPPLQSYARRQLRPPGPPPTTRQG